MHLGRVPRRNQTQPNNPQPSNQVQPKKLFVSQIQTVEYTYPSGNRYKGEIVNGKRHGYGEYRDEELKFTYKGEFRNNIPYGLNNELIDEDRHRFTGEFDSQFCLIKGKIEYTNGDSYEGTCKNNIRDGKGKYCSKVSTYSGGFKDGLMCGDGVLTHKDGRIYFGSFANNFIVQGSVKYPADSPYNPNHEVAFFSGKFVDGRPADGEGKFTYFDGCIVTGNVTNGALNGKCIYTTPDESILEVNFKNGNPNGYGVYTCHNGDIYEGNFNEKYRINGIGKIYRHRSLYEGEIKNDKMSGRGKLTLENGTIYEGIFEDNKPLAGIGTITYSNGNIYHGACSNFVPSGYGEFTYKDTNLKYEGYFIGMLGIVKNCHNVKEELGNVKFNYSDGTMYNNSVYTQSIEVENSIVLQTISEIYVSQHIENGGIASEQTSNEIDDIQTISQCKVIDYKYPSGATYKGQVSNDMTPEGYGELVDINGDKYIGNFVNGILEGDGVCIWSYGCQYNGSFKSGVPHGIGKYVLDSGEEYEVTFKEGILTHRTKIQKPSNINEEQSLADVDQEQEFNLECKEDDIVQFKVNEISKLRLQPYIIKAFMSWVKRVNELGIEAVRRESRFDDEELSGKFKNCNSVRLNDFIRVVYFEDRRNKNAPKIIARVTKHKYR